MMKSIEEPNLEAACQRETDQSKYVATLNHWDEQDGVKDEGKKSSMVSFLEITMTKSCLVKKEPPHNAPIKSYILNDLQ